MEKGCSVASSNCESAEDDAQQERSSSSSSSRTGSKLKPLTPQEASQRQRHPQPKPSTSQARLVVAESMSKLREDVEDCVSSNSQHGFAVVLDDESSTETGVLETYEISSSNSLPTSTGGGAASTVGVVVPVDDSSSTDTLNGNENGRSEDDAASEERQSVFFNVNDTEPPVVCLINDDDDFDEEEIVEEEDDDDDDDDEEVRSMPTDCPNNTSQIDGSAGIGCSADGIITTADGSKIFLETPVVDEPQSHTHASATAGNPAATSELLAGKPKRLSDEFEAEEQNAPPQGVKSETECGQADVASSSLHDRQMSVRLKQMSLTASAEATAAASSTASNSSSTLSQADIDSMDRIERCDFETEQRLTGGIILGTSSLISKNRLNLSLINRAAAAAAAAGAGAGGGAATAGAGGGSDDWPSSSQARAFSSDSKCTYKDLSTTPTSSRKYTNSRLSKSTAKLNLGSTLDYAIAACPQHSSSTNSKMPFVVLVKSSSVNSSGSGSSSSSSNASTSTSNRTDVYTSTNSNDNLNASATSCQQQSDKDAAAPLATSFSSVGSQTSQESGCSRTSVLAKSLDVDAQPSTSATSTTSSARCHYAAATVKAATRQVNASAQTQERFLARSGLAAGGNNNNNRPRRRIEATRNSANDAIVLGIVVEENPNNGDNGGGGGVGGGGGGVVEPGDFSAEEPWGNCDEENNCSDLEEICTCQNSILATSRSGSNASLSEALDMDAMDSYHDEAVASSDCVQQQQQQQQQQQRKRKYNEGRMLDGDYSMSITGSGGAAGGGLGSNAGTGDNSRNAVMLTMTPTTTTGVGLVGSSPALGRRTPRALMPTRDNPPPELQHWLAQFQRWSHAERLLAVDRLIDHCDPSQVRHMMKVIEPQFQRDFISLLPRELALFVLSYLEPKDLLRAAQTCRSWRFLCDDNLLWKEKCRKAQILTETRSDRPKRGRDGNMPPIASPWKAAYMRQHIIEMNWRSRPVRKPKVLKGHDDHVITCLQFSGNRIVSGSDDNTLKVWSAVNGKCLRTLVGHTGGVWSSQMSGNIIISGSTDRTLKVWDMESGSCVHTLQGHTSTVRCMHLHGNKVVSGSRDATLRVWDIELGTCLHVLVGHLAAVRCVQYDGKLIVSGAYDYMVKIWHPERQECLHTLQGHTNRVYSLQFDGLHVVSGSLDTSIRVWDVETGNCKHTLMGHQSLTSGMELRQNILVSGNADSTVKVWDITTGQCLQTLSGPNKHQSAVTCLQFNSRFVVTSSDDGTVKLWDVKTGDFIRNLVALDSGGSGGVVWRIRANDTKLICAVGSRNGTEETKLMVLDFDVEGACVKCS
ncbi:F-box/WD repeat-containing protein 7 isoform X2 [Drosophila novamexicana]|uniref:F-box/WD repeat-containing protein 7 isoform X2 n=1 Tax=Drosophila novamexicana TaxID=47314 RepID=UPI0011E5F728|nr:F-box/WD repeat-containing protein 7 isoform X2 [Drosophila novamexicana]